MNAASIGGFEVDHNKIDRTYDWTLENGHIFAYERNGEVVGVFGGLVIEPIFNSDKIFQELFLCFKEDSIMCYPKLIKYVMDVIDADGILLVHMADAERIGRLYEKLGFKELERQYIWKRTK